ncbi:unnamed protein product [Notodromas monacha]|uniref:Uncharacterized protein n=1 Tax=Notodromas monacha TaxID=399045 RepID=A0A7R9BFW4_9CRUS|nr:unnamed protein product [Notodromas monacha]CAG0913094.1 unnamed protein product [Notodromas monacha]
MLEKKLLHFWRQFYASSVSFHRRCFQDFSMCRVPQEFNLVRERNFMEAKDESSFARTSADFGPAIPSTPNSSVTFSILASENLWAAAQLQYTTHIYPKPAITQEFGNVPGPIKGARSGEYVIGPQIMLFISAFAKHGKASMAATKQLRERNFMEAKDESSFARTSADFGPAIPSTPNSSVTFSILASENLWVLWMFSSHLIHSEMRYHE